MGGLNFVVGGMNLVHINFGYCDLDVEEFSHDSNSVNYESCVMLFY